MYLVQLLLPLADPQGNRFERDRYDRISKDLTARFGGVTAYSRAPADGLWLEEPGKPVRDDIVVYEVMVESLDAKWWAGYRAALEEVFRQEELVVRALPFERL